MTELRKDLPPLTTRVAALPIDGRGWPVPWFVQLIDGEPDHRIMDSQKLMKAWHSKLCWICGQPLGGAFVTFPVGPMCAVNRVSAEPPSHFECAEWSVRGCPFLSRPHARRRDHNYPDGAVEADGEMIRRNPGVILLWTTKRVTAGPFAIPNGGMLFNIGEPHELLWYAEGRYATREEILASMESGLPILEESAVAQGEGAQEALEEAYGAALALVPA